jgi:hypothetical protein
VEGAIARLGVNERVIVGLLPISSDGLSSIKRKKLATANTADSKIVELWIYASATRNLDGTRQTRPSKLEEIE